MPAPRFASHKSFLSLLYLLHSTLASKLCRIHLTGNKKLKQSSCTECLGLYIVLQTHWNQRRTSRHQYMNKNKCNLVNKTNFTCRPLVLFEYTAMHVDVCCVDTRYEQTRRQFRRLSDLFNLGIFNNEFLCPPI